MAKKSKKKASVSVQEPRESASTETQVRRAEVEAADNRPVIKNVIILVLVLLGLYLLFSFISGRNDQEDGDQAVKDETSQVEESDKADDNKNGEEAEPNGTSVKETDKEFDYIVGAGESYTTMARRAVAGIDSELTPAERVAAETKLTTNASAEWLNEGQDLVLSKDTVRAAVDWAKSLSDGQKADWQPYADLVAW